jgi:pyrroloquinoline quinone (PQQ) biosynthesis protein C
MNTTETHETHEAEIPDNPRYSREANELIAELDRRVQSTLDEVRAQPFWKTLNAPDTTPQVVQKIFREVFLSICMYQPVTTEAGFHMLGRLPKHEIMLMRASMLHKIEEAEHGEWARRDYVRLGGDEKAARTIAPTPTTFAVGSVWWQMANVEDPVGYFGAEYLFESLTAVIAQDLVGIFKKHKMAGSGLEFIIDHATEDVKHAKLFRHLICNTATKYPESAAAMLRCYDYFRHVYPIPVWNEAYARAMAAV